MSTDSQTVEQLLAARVTSIYQMLMGHPLKQVSCHFLSTHAIAILLEGAITQPEKLLLSSGYGDLVQVIRQHLNDIIRPRIIAEVETVLQRGVIDSPNDVKFESDRMSFILVLTEPSNKAQNGLFEKAAGG
ncbi:MAG: Na-translocating system protein MpsC family protein [Cyanobacteria bacterium P01_A01_bin.17]